jgi:hypothetical protein
MELEELEVPQLCTDMMSQRPPIRSGDLRIGGDGIELAHPARSQDYRRRRESSAFPPVR